MREIKFRAWRKTVKEIMEWEDLKYWDTPLGEDDDHILMQYTGLKDKNGKEIYEGDVVKITEKHDNNLNNILKDEGESIVKIEFVDGCFGFYDEDKTIFLGFSSLWYWKKHYSSKKTVEEILKEKFEIIGNIHSNPELLNK